MEAGLVDRFATDLTTLGQDGFCPNVYDRLRQKRTLLLPPENISTTECAVKYRRLRAKEGAGTVEWDQHLTPYIPGIQDALDDPQYRYVCTVGPGRTGKSVAGENHLFKRLRTGPLTDTIIYLQAGSDIDSYADKEFRDFFVLHDEIADKLGDTPSDDKRKFKRVAGRTVQLLPANPGNVRQKEATFIIASEIDGYRKTVVDGFKDNIGTRMVASGNQAKAYIESHPDLGWVSGVASIWKESTRGIWYQPCPQCNGWSSPNPMAPKKRIMKLNYTRPDGMSDDELLDHVEDTACLECPHCGHPIEEEQRIPMVEAGRWVFDGEVIQKNGKVKGKPKRSDTAGFWIHGTMSPFNHIGKLARKYVAAVVYFERTRRSQRLKEVTVKDLGEVYEGPGDKRPVNPQELQERERGFELGTYPDWVDFITAAIDIGGAKFDVLYTGWDFEGRCALIDRYTIRETPPDELGHTRELRPAERQADWMMLQKRVLERIIPSAKDDSIGLPVAACAIDLQGADGTTPKAREFARRMSVAGIKWGNWPRVRLVRGGSTKKAPRVPTRGRAVNVDDEGRKLEPSVLEWTLNVDKIRDDIVDRLGVEDDGPGQVHFANNLPKSAFEELAGEIKVDDEWKRVGANETLDLLGYNEASRIMLKPDRKGIKWRADDAGPAKLPIWARPVVVHRRAVDEDTPEDAKKAKPKKSIFEEFDELNNEN